MNQPIVDNDKEQIIPKTIAAYLEQATFALVKESKYEPQNEGAMKQWVEDNFPAIVLRAVEMQRATFEKVISDTPVGHAIRKLLCTQVWCDIKIEEVNERTKREMNQTVRSIFHDETDLHMLMFNQ